MHTVDEKTRTCQHCLAEYHPAKSKTTLRLTYCGVLCEKAHLGFTIESLLRIERDPDWPTKKLLREVGVPAPEPIEF